MKPSGGLPEQLTTFIGRESTVELVGRRLVEHRMVSLVGPGGCGKTRLALEVARRAQAEQWTVCFVDLSGLSGPALLVGAVRSAIGLAEARGRTGLMALADQLSGHKLLLLLDNCEHLLDACAQLAEVLLGRCPGVRLLATSRERLGLPGEAVVAVGGLGLPDRSAAGTDGWLERSEAGRLFLERARMARADFSLAEGQALSVAAICEQLDGVPLALELAAARASAISVGAIAEGLSDRFRLLSARRRTGPARHKTLLASIEWSCHLLEPEERALLYHLSVFTSGFTLDAARAVYADGAEGPDDVLRLLGSLVDQSLVEALPGAGRFRLHETMRAYATARLGAEASVTARDRHLGYFAQLAKELGPKHWTSDVTGSLRRLEADLGNLRAALDWAAESGQFDLGAEVMGAVGDLFYTRCLRAEAFGRCQELLAGGVSPERRPAVLLWAALCSVNLDPTASLGLAKELTALGRSFGDEVMVARGLVTRAYVHGLGEPDKTVAVLDEALPLARRLGQHDLVVLGLVYKCAAYRLLCRPREGLEFTEEALRVAESAGWQWGAMRARATGALAALWSGQLQVAVDEAGILLRFAEERSHPLFAVLAGLAQSEVARYRSDARAVELAERARVAALASGDLVNAACSEAVKGKALVWSGNLEEGYELLERAFTELEALGVARGHGDIRAEIVEAALRRGDTRSARLHLGAAIRRVPGNNEPSAVPLLRAGARLARAEDEPKRAHESACDGLDLACDGGTLLFAIELLELAAITRAELGRPAQAARLLGAAERQRDLTGYIRPAFARDELAPALADMQSALGRDGYERAVSEGRALTLDEAVVYARRGRDRHARPRSGWESLTPSEQTVASLVGQHLTNAEIAERLYISVPTVKSHLNRAFAKLGITNRGQLAAAAHRHVAGDEGSPNFNGAEPAPGAQAVPMRAPVGGSAPTSPTAARNTSG